MTDPTPSTPVTIRDQLHILSENLRGSSNHTLSTIWTKLDTLETSIDELKAQVTLLQEGLGASPYQALTLTTTRGLLNAILGRLTTLALGTAPDNGGDVVSGENTIYDGRKYAIFDTPIPGATISADGREISRSSWVGWQYYIQTTDPSPWANGVPTVPNIWAPMTIFSTYDFSVETQYPITVYLRDTVIVPTEPYILWSGTAVAPLVSNPFGGESLYFDIEVPTWADRIQYRYNTTACSGNWGWYIPPMTGGPNGVGGCRDGVSTIPVGFMRYLQTAGDLSHRITGYVWALAPGVDPVP